MKPSGITADDLPIREELRGVSAYGAPQLDVPIRLNTNENPHPPGDEVVAAIAAELLGEIGHLQRYPDRDAVALRSALAAYLSDTTGVELATENVWAANGSNEILAQLLALFAGPDRSALGFEPTYSMHSIIARGANTAYRNVPRAADFAIDLVAATTAITSDPPAITFVCSPNNPTGTAVDLDAISELYAVVADQPLGILVVDEAYAEFSSTPSAVTLLPGRPRLIVTRTMSKAFAFAGARVGYLAADPSIVEAIGRVRLPYHLSSLTQAAARGALAHANELQFAVEELKEQRDRIVAAAHELGLPVADSDANFVLIGGFGDQVAAWEHLLEAGVLVRDVGLPGWLRVTAGTTAETAAFLAALTSVVQHFSPTPPEE
ncbi:MAG: histidinol-phosphate transaminase, partial [Actinobacteria bacterium]|nr:histidinol-phosphate transaminase [Actinomycetota bacterium]